jgi:hypothetical protein
LKKLIAVGTTKEDPKTWNCWEEVAIYVADSIKDALEMDNRGRESAVELNMDTTRLILRMPDFPDD